MRVFQINTYCGIKSTGRITYDIACLVNQNGGECKIAYGVPDISEESKRFSLRIGITPERKIHSVIRKLFDAEGYGSIRATYKLLKQIRTFQPDIVHLHNLHGAYLNLSILFHGLQKMNIPIVWTLHDCWSFTGHCAYFDACGCEKWKSGCKECPQLNHYPVCIGLDGSARNWNLKKKLFTMPEKIVFVPPCNWLGLLLKDSYLQNYTYKVIHNGIDRNVFKPDSEKADVGETNIILAVASEWDERKGLSYVIDAAKQLGSKYHFVVIGLNREQINTLPESITGIEHTSNVKELVGWYNRASCLINPTLEDNMPMVNIEAMACGTPVVAFDTGGCREAIGNDCGMIVPKKDLEALCNAVRIICADKEKYRAACIRRSADFDIRTVYTAYLDLYRELIG